MIRVARIITRLNVGGPAIQAVSLSSRLEDLGYHTLLIHGRLGEGEGDMSYLVPPDRRFECEQVPSLLREVSPASDAAAVLRVARLLQRFQPSIVHTHTAKAGAVGRVAAIAANALRGRGGARLVHTYHGHVLDGYFGAGAARAFGAVERMLASRTDALVTVARSVRDDLLNTHRIGTAERFHIVPLGFDLQRFAAVSPTDRESARRAFGIPADAHVVAFVGRLTGIKRPELFLEVAAQVARADDRARFLIAGGGDLEAAMRRRASELHLDDRLIWLGWKRDLVPVYAASDVLALTSRNEGTPVAVIEALAAAIPVVAFAVGGVPDVVTSDELSPLVRDGDVNAMSVSLGTLLGNAGERAALGARARASVLARYGVERLVCDVDRLYRSLL